MNKATHISIHQSHMSTHIEVVTTRCWPSGIEALDRKIGLYFSYVADSFLDYPCVYSVMDDFGNLVKVR